MAGRRQEGALTMSPVAVALIAFIVLIIGVAGAHLVETRRSGRPRARR
jgi:hypothetical protein